MTSDEQRLLTIATMYSGVYEGGLAALTQMCVVEGSALPDDTPPVSAFEEALTLLEICVEKWSTPRPSDRMTVFIGCRARAGAKIEPLARLDGTARNGLSGASVTCEDGPVVNAVSVRYLPDDDTATIVLKILSVLVREH
ncbi:hypothetical protein [Paraburkholderia sp. DGU8]|uniref:hypothetical protein n=1 Tax=Paraburkholderia sp. DGU8 TaxID=3161997 RepID=UPI003465F6D3